MRVQSRVIKKSKRLVLAPVIFIVMLAVFLQYRWMKSNPQEYGSKFGIELIHCETCYGTGLIPDKTQESGFIFCPQCLGLSGNFIKRIDDLDAVCPACGGIGRVEDLTEEGTFRYCKRCNGRGLIRTVYADSVTLQK